MKYRSHRRRVSPALLLQRALAIAILAIAVLASSCVDQDVLAPAEPASLAISPTVDAADLDDALIAPAVLRRMIDSVRQLAVSKSFTPLPNPPRVRVALVHLGQMLLFDPLLSGNRDISCMTCHHPTLATTDARHLSIGQGAKGLGPTRVHPQGAFIPRNAPALFNISTTPSLFWDGRVSVDSSGHYSTPAGAALTTDMTKVFEFGAASALGLFPVTSREEMRAFTGNELARIPDAEVGQIWTALMKRLSAVPAYRKLFELAYPGTRFSQMTFAHASNAMAGFMVDRLSFSRTPWDRLLRGENSALTPRQLRGAQFFLTQNCSICHSGASFTGNAFANVALAQLGPGQGDGPGRNDDFGRERVTGIAGDRYKFRTPTLRNVELTAPYGHAGQFVRLRDFIDHYSESDKKLVNYNPRQLEPLLRGTVLPNAQEILLTRTGLLSGFVMTAIDVERLTAFMHALTDPAARSLNHLIPARVPSGLPVR